MNLLKDYLIKGKGNKTTKEIVYIENLLKVLKDNGVEYFKDAKLEVKISPVKLIHSLEDKLEKEKEKVSEDDLYYSSTTLKPRIK